MSKVLRIQFGRRVRDLRQAAGMSQEAFADHCGFARSYISRVERGNANPSIDAIETLAAALGVDEVELFTRVGGGPAALMVPYANDGTCFHPGLRRPQTQNYDVGGKGSGNVLRFKSFDEALQHLRSMPTAHWWRPNVNRNWGLVSAVRWGPLPSVEGKL